MNRCFISQFVSQFICLLSVLSLAGCGDKTPVQNESEVSMIQWQACTQQVSVINPSNVTKGWQASCLPQKKPKQCDSGVYALLKKQQTVGCDQSTLQWVSATVADIKGGRYCQLPYQQGQEKGQCVPAKKPKGTLCTPVLFKQVSKATGAIFCDKIVSPMVAVEGYNHCVVGLGNTKFCLPKVLLSSCQLKVWQTLKKSSTLNDCTDDELKVDKNRSLFKQKYDALHAQQAAQTALAKVNVKIKQTNAKLVQVNNNYGNNPSGELAVEINNLNTILHDAEQTKQDKIGEIADRKSELAGYTVPNKVTLLPEIYNVEGYTECLVVGSDGKPCQPKDKPTDPACTKQIWETIQGVGGNPVRCSAA